jgi:hypothetical protein
VSFRYWYKNDDGDLVEFTDRVQVGWAENPGTSGLTMNAEEGTLGVCDIRVEDPDGDWDFPRGHRYVLVIEDQAEYDDFGGVIYKGYTNTRTFERDLMRTGAARIINMNLQDINIVFDRRIMAGSENNRPAETDVERIAWLLTTNEAALIDDDFYFSTDQPVDMDAVDYRGQSFRQIVSDCSLQSGKNWYLWPSLGGNSLWYQPRGTDDFSSTSRISNVIEDLDDYEDTYAPAIDSKMTRDPDRVYSGIYRAYATSYVYTQNEDTATAFARRDTFATSPNVKTKLKAIVRNERELADISTEEDIITTSVIVSRPDVNCIVPGQRVQVRYSHFPTFEDDFQWVRVLNRTVRELGPDQIELALELTRDEPAIDTGGVGAVFGVLGRAKGYDRWDYVWFEYVGDAPIAGAPIQPTVGLIEALNDPAGPLAPSWDYFGWKINGTGTVDVKFYCSTVGVTGGIDITFEIRKNGVAVASETKNTGPHMSADMTVIGLAIPVVPDDVISAYIQCDPAGLPFFQAPRGTGDNAEALTITGGTVV